MPVINVNGQRLSYRQSGQGPTVIALHSTASNSKQWKSLTAHLEQRYTVITPDLPGYGRSDPWPEAGPASLNAEANFIFALMEERREPVHLVGHSYGAAVAFKIAMTRPGWVRSLTMIEPAMFHVLRDGDAADQKLFAEISSVAGIVNASVAEGEPQAGMARFIDFWNGEGSWAKTTQALRENFTGQVSQVMNNFVAAFEERWNIKRARMISCPTLAIMGLEGPACAQRVTEMLAENIPDARLAIIPEAGHMAPLTDPHIVDPLIAGHMQAVDIGWAVPAKPQENAFTLPMAA
ncbi:MAG: alpha/beta fold hydrolase [Hyphomicrobiales bacterium]